MKTNSGMGFMRHPLKTPSVVKTMAGWLEATHTASYAGTGQTLSSLIPSPSDGTAQAANSASRGATTSSSTDDPTFSGTAGTASACFTLDGGDSFTQQNATLTSASILNNAHRSDVTGAYIAWAGIVPLDNSVAHGLCGNASSGTQQGFELSISTSGVLQFIQRGATSLTVSMLGVPRGVPVLIIVSWNGAAATNNIRCWINTTTKAQFSGTFGTATAATNRNMTICGSNALKPMANGTVFRSFLYGNSFIDNAQVRQIFALLQTRHGISYRAAPAQIIMAGIGDSMTYYNIYNRGGTSADMEANGDGQYINYAALTNYKVRFPAANNMGVSGDTTAMIAARMATAVQGKAFDVVFIMAGTNDVGFTATSTSAEAQSLTSTAIANLNAIYDYFATTLGKRVMAVTIPPRNKWGSFTSTQISYGRQNIKTINAAIVAQNATRNGRVHVLDLYSILNDGSDSPLAGATVDLLHFSPYGAMLYGRGIRDQLATIYGSASLPDFTVNNLLANGTLTGAGGSKTGVTGSVADSFSAILSGGTGASPTVSASKPSSTLQQLAFNCPAGASSAASLKLSQSISGGFSAGDTVYAQAVVEVMTPLPVRILESSLNLVLTGTGTSGLTSVTGMGPYGAGVYVAETYALPGQYLVQTPDLTIASGTGLSLEWFYRMTGDTASGLAASGTVQIKGASIIKR